MQHASPSAVPSPPKTLSPTRTGARSERLVIEYTGQSNQIKKPPSVAMVFSKTAQLVHRQRYHERQRNYGSSSDEENEDEDCSYVNHTSPALLFPLTLTETIVETGGGTHEVPENKDVDTDKKRSHATDPAENYDADKVRDCDKYDHRHDFDEGCRVEARYLGKNRYFSGLVRHVHSNGQVDVLYDDGEIERRIEASLVRALPGQKVWPLPWETDAERESRLFRELKARWIERVLAKGRDLQNAPTEMQSDRDVVMSAVSNNAFWGLESACDELKDNFDVVLAAVSKDGWALQHASKKRRGDHTIVMAAVSQNGGALRWASEELKGTRNIVLAAVGRDARALDWASEELRFDSEVLAASRPYWIRVVGEHGYALAAAPRALRGDRDVVLAAVRRHGLALKSADTKLRADREVVLAAVTQYGPALMHADVQLRDNREIVTAAVRGDGYWGLRSASATMRANREVVLIAVKQEGRALRYASADLKADREVVLAAVAQDGRALEHAPEYLRADRDLVLVAARTCGALQFASQELREDSEVAAAIPAEYRKYALRLVPEERKADRDVLILARQVAADEYLDLSPEEQAIMQYQLERHESNGELYFGSLNAALTDTATALVKVEYIIALDDTARKNIDLDNGVSLEVLLQHRAELPSEAFYFGPITENELIVAYSYCWRTREHPDPDGSHVRDLAMFLRFLMNTYEFKNRRILLFMDWVSLYQDSPTGSRSPYHSTMYQNGLQNAHFWFMHPSVLTIQNRNLPAGRDQGFEESGWPKFEDSLSRLVKDPSKVINLQSVLGWLTNEAVHATEKVSFYNFMEKGGNRDARALPLTPQQFANDASHMYFGVESDRKYLPRKYREVFTTALSYVKVLQLGNISGASSEDWEDFLNVALPLCTKLEKLYLKDNGDLKVDVAAIADLCLGSENTLTNLNLGNTACFGEAATALTSRYRALTMLNLEGSNVAGTIRDLKEVLPKGCWIRL